MTTVRRRSRRHRRNRAIRAVFIVFCAALTLGFAAVALRHLSPSLFRSSWDVEPTRQSAEASRNLAAAAQQETLREIENRQIYPYSVVPGGVRDALELKAAAQRDPIVAAHYRGFDYDHARVVRLVLARTAYVSYRIGNKIYWTRHRISLKKGETIITDGKITARARCANRVEEAPQAAYSKSEPPAVMFEQPVRPVLGTAVANPPVPFESSLLNRQGVPGLGPAPPLSLYDPLNGVTFVPISPPPLPSVCGIGTKKKPGSGGGPVNGKKKKGNPCENGGPGGEAPEPSTWVLLVVGLSVIYWMSRQKLARE